MPDLPPPGDPGFALTPYNKQAVRDWLISQGIAAERVDSMREGTLYKAYAKPAYLRAILTRGDYAPGAAKAPAPRPMPSPSGYEPQASMPEPDQPQPRGWSPTLENDVSQQPIPNGRAKPDQFDALMALQAGIQAIAGQTINEDRVIELIQQHAPTRETVREIIVIQRDAERSELPVEPRHHLFPDVLTAVLANIPVMLVGPAGAGKTTLGHQIAAALDLSFSHTGAVSSRYELSGYNDAHGNYQATSFRKAYEHGGLFLFDEIDGSDPAALLWCNTAIANGVCAFPDGNIVRHENFRLIAAANTYGRGADRVYVGRNPLDGASTDRFVVVDFDYDADLERLVFGDTDWTKRVQSVRDAISTLKLRHIVSPRATDYGKRLIAAGMAQDKVETMTIWKGLERDQIQKIEHAILDRRY